MFYLLKLTIFNQSLKNGNKSKFLFNSYEMLEDFMEFQLGCTKFELTKCYLFKTILFAYKAYKKARRYNNQIKMCQFWRSIYYHAWFTSGEIAKENCICVYY